MTRRPGDKKDITVFANSGTYASFPQLIRTDREVVLLFQAQDLESLRQIPEHPHYQKVAQPFWSVSTDQGHTWQIHKTAPKVGKVLDTTNPSAPLKNGGMLTLSFHQGFPKYALHQQGLIAGYRPYQTLEIPETVKYPIAECGPFSEFFPFGAIRTGRDEIIASGYAGIPNDPTHRTTTVFIKSVDEGKTWTYLSSIANDTSFSFTESDLIEYPNGLLQVYLRTDVGHLLKDARPADSGAEFDVFGYYLYRAESSDGGRTWSSPVQLPIWGHPPCVRPLASGHLLLVCGVRRQPQGILAALSRDQGKTWKTKTVYPFNPGAYDLGYPVITQFPDGSILCAYYGYSTTDLDTKSPHGIFASIFDEAWLTA